MAVLLHNNHMTYVSIEGLYYIPEHGQWSKVWGKQFSLVLSLSGCLEQNLVKVSHIVVDR